jgi:hypothetical protein
VGDHDVLLPVAVDVGDDRRAEGVVELLAGDVRVDRLPADEARERLAVRADDVQPAGSVDGDQPGIISPL